MKRKRREMLFGIILLILSATFYIAHYIIFRDSHHIFIYMVGDIAFVFVEVLLVTLIIHRLLENREKKAVLDKMNMVVGAFFSQLGTELLEYLNTYHKNLPDLKKELLIKANWSQERFTSLAKEMKTFRCNMDSRSGDIYKLKEYLIGKTDFLLGMLENPILLEKDTFTDMLWAVFHLADELSVRKSFDDLPETDLDHLSIDMQRTYKALIIEWLHYLEHLKVKYPYLFSLAIRKNPFDENSSVIVGEQ